MKSISRRASSGIRRACLSASALTSLVLLASPAHAIVINDGLTPTAAVDNNGGVNGVGQMVVDEQNGFIGLCTVTLINPRTVIFASHCVNESPAGNAFEPATGYGAANGGLPIGFFFNVNNNQAGNSAIGHWLNGVSGGPKDLTRVADNAYNSNFVVYNTNCCTIGLGNNFLQSDVAMAALDTPVVGIPTWTTLFSPLTAPAHATITGYGDNGTGTSGQGTIDFKRRVAENVVSMLGSLDDQDKFLFGAPDGLPANLYMMDFNDPNFHTAQANVFDFNIFHDSAYLPGPNGNGEGITAPGDSGGPLIIDHTFTDSSGNSVKTIAGVLSGGDRFFNAQPGASYGTTSFYQPLYLYWDWIVSNNPYKYVGNVAGDGSWTDAAHWKMNLDPAYVMADSSGHLVNALPTTPAGGETNQPPGFGEVCYFDDCINITTGVHTNPTPAPGPNPTSGPQPFGGMLGKAGFDALVAQYVAAQGGQVSSGGITSGGPETVSDSTFADSASSSGGAMGGGGGSHLSPSDTNPASPQSNWNNPEGNGTAGGETVQGAPGSAAGAVPNDTNANVHTGAPARYYDVTLAADGKTTLSGATITIDRLTVNGAHTELRIASNGHLTSLIDTTIDAGVMQVDGTYDSVGSIGVQGGLLAGSGTVTAPDISIGMGIVTGGDAGKVGTLTLDTTLAMSALATYLADFTPFDSDLVQVSGNVAIDGMFAENFANGTYTTGKVYTVLTTTGTLSGHFADALVLSMPPGEIANLSYDAHNVFVTLEEAPFVWGMTGTGNWNKPGNWQYHLPPSANDVAIFDAGTQTSVKIDSAAVAKSLQFNAGAPAYSFTITGTASGAAALTLSGGIANASSNAPTFKVSGTSEADAGFLTFNGVGTAANATITAGNFGAVSFNGLTDAGSDATLIAHAGGFISFFGTTGDLNDHNVNAGSIAGAGEFELGANTLTTGALNTSTEVSGQIFGSGGLTKVGSGTLILSGGNLYTGVTTISDGTLQIGHGGTSGSINSASIVDNTTLAFDRSNNLLIGAVISGNGELVKMGNGGLVLTGTNTYAGTTTISKGTLQIDEGGTAGTLGAGEVIDNGVLSFDRSNAMTVANLISGTGSVAQIGSGTVTLTGANTYSGMTVAGGDGTLRAGAAGTFSSASAFEVIGTLDLNGFSQTIGSLDGIGSVLLGDAELTTNGDNSSTEFDGTINGAGGLTKTGSGTLILNGINGYSGGTTISAGTLQIGKGGTIGMITGDVVDNGTLVFDRSDSGLFEGVISGSGALTKLGAGTLALTAANTYSGGTTITAGTLQIGNGGTTGAIVGNVVDNATLVFAHSNDVSFGGVVSGTGSLTQGGSGKLTLTGNNTYTGGTTVASGILQLGSGGATGMIAGNIVDNAILAFDRSDDVTFAHVISGSGMFDQAGTGKLTLTGTNTYSGGTLISAGTLQIGSGGTSGAITGDVEDDATLVFDRSDTVTFGGSVVGTGALTKVGSGTLVLSGASNYSGGTTIESGTLQVGTGGTTGMINGDVVDDGALVFDRADDGPFDGVISGSGSVTQAGTGNLFLTAANTYTGATTVSQGILTVNGSIAASAVTVGSGAELSGSGTVGGLTTESGATLAPGPQGSIGTLTVNGDATLSDGTSLLVAVNKETATKLAVTGTLSLSGDVTVSNLVGYTPHYGDSGVIATAASITGNFSSVLDALPGVLKATVTIVPEEGDEEALLKISADSYLTVFTPTSKDEITIATALDNARASHYAELSALYDLLDTETDGTLSQSLENLTPDAVRALGLVGQFALANFDGAVTDHLSDIGQPPQGDSAAPGFLMVTA